MSPAPESEHPDRDERHGGPHRDEDAQAELHGAHVGVVMHAAAHRHAAVVHGNGACDRQHDYQSGAVRSKPPPEMSDSERAHLSSVPSAPRSRIIRGRVPS